MVGFHIFCNTLLNYKYNIFENHISIMSGYDELLLDSHSKNVKFYRNNNWRAWRNGLGSGSSAL